MATRKRKSSKSIASSLEATPSQLDPEGSDPATSFGAQPTGRLLATFPDTSARGIKSTVASIRSQAGLSSVAHAKDFKTQFSMAEAEEADMVVLDELGIAVMTGPPDQMQAMSSFSTTGSGGVILEPEYMNYAFSAGLDGDVVANPPGESAPPVESGGPPESFASYLRGYRDSIDHMLRVLGGTSAAGILTAEADSFEDTSEATWGLHATGVLDARTTGAGIRVAVLDTGFDLLHPDFQGRDIESSSFIAGESVQDGNGHGTHCIGTACGPVQPGIGPRYGIASEAEIFAGKVLSNAGSGGDGSILAGINWAVQNGCAVISMSLGRMVRRGESPQANYQTAGRRALAAGSLILAAAGNDSSRPFVEIPVSSPANAGTIAAIGAVDRNLRVASFSNRGINPAGGEINLVGPGVDVHSSWPMPVRLRSIDGTSMATPHVAGIAALIAEESDSFRGIELYRELRRRARALPLPRADVGNGLVQV